MHRWPVCLTAAIGKWFPEPFFFRLFQTPKGRQYRREEAGCLPPISGGKGPRNFFEKNSIFLKKRLAIWIPLWYNTFRQVITA